MSNNEEDFLDAYIALRRELTLISSQELKKHKIGVNQMKVMGHLGRVGQATLSELADMTQSDPASTSRTVNALEKLGWIKRSVDPQDQRRSFVELTAKGRKHSGGLHELRAMITAKVNECVSKKEQSEIVKIMTKIIDKLQNERKTQG